MLIQEKLKTFDGDHPVVLNIAELAAWRRANGGCRLHLPPIQRSVVWSNEQIVNYWDSLLRGYPPGMMMVHRAVGTTHRASQKGLDAEGHTRDVDDGDFQLFDGQQRMAAVLLGMGEGQLKASRRLWVDLGIVPKPHSGLKFQLRITTTGQPFGYQPEAPNQKLGLGKRQQQWTKWFETSMGDRAAAFAQVTGGDQLIDAVCAAPFAEICMLLQQKGSEGSIAALCERQGALKTVVIGLVRALEGALQGKVILQQVAPEIVADQDEYIRFFGRLGQGGTRLSDDELTYSIIKHQHPEIRDRMEAITRGPAGRLAGEVDLVLATLRVAKTCAPWTEAKEWEIIGRPNPAFVSQLSNDERKAGVQKLFLSLIDARDSQQNLQRLLEGLRKALTYDSQYHPSGLPAVLLARFPRELIDVLILFSVKRITEHEWSKDDKELLTAFVLHWLLFVGDDAGAASQAYLHAKEDTWCWSFDSIRSLIHALEENGIARYLPRPEQLSELRNGVVCSATSSHLRTWHERFKEVDVGEEHKPGEALRILSTNNELVKRALMWLQRSYIAQTFPDYDPTSGRDEDLPIDLDHIIPNSIFGFDWRSRDAQLGPQVLNDASALDNFRWQRGVVGNSLGNFRWIDASTNRSRGNGEYVPLGNEDDLVGCPEGWNSIIPRGSRLFWGAREIAKFQNLIDLRTLELYERLILGSGIAKIVS